MQEIMERLTMQTSLSKSANNIWLWEVRRALGISITNENTRENAITRVRQVLIQYENTLILF